MRWIIVGLVATVFLAIYISVLTSFHAESPLELRSAEDVSPTSEYVMVKLNILEIDPVLRKVWLRLTPEPAGGLRANNRPVPAQALTLRIDGARASLGNALTQGQTERVYTDGENLAPVDAVTILTNGSVGNFPFDHYLFHFRLSVTTPDPADPKGYRTLPVLLQPDPDAGLAGYTFAGEVSRVDPAYGMAPEAVELNVAVRRSPAAFWYSILLMTIAGALALGCVSVAIAIAFDPGYIQPAFFAWMSATLFAIVGLRRLLPGNPPFASLPDFLVFMWAEIFVTLALISLVIAYLRQKPQS
jgi:hypothetical protein